MTQLTVTRQGFAPATITEAMEFSKMLADSSMVPRAYQGKPQDIMVCVQWGYEIGLAPMQALQNIAVINGKPSVYGDAAMALVQASPVCEGVEEYMEGEGTPNPVAVCVAHRKGRKPVTAKFSVEDAKRAGLWGKQGPWQAYPKRMLAMRARGFALRDAFPDVLKGLITAEEAQDFPDEAKPKAARNPLDALAPPVPTKEISEPMVLESVTFHTDAQVNGEDIPAGTTVHVEAVASEIVDVVETSGGFAIMVPGKEQPFSTHQTLEQWAEAYEALAEKMANTAKLPARERMTKLRELKDLNKQTLEKIDSVTRIKHTASYQKRIRALGAAQ
jgi:hypothetical protein